MQVSTPLSAAPSEPAQPAQPVRRRVLPSWLVAAAFVVALIGFVDTTYLSVKSIQGGPIACSFTEGCDVVTTSAYSRIAGIPIALLGALYYLLVLLVLFYYLDTGKIGSVRILGWFTAIPFLFSLWLTYVQWGVLKAFCQYCLLSAATSTLLFIFGMCMVQYAQKER